MLQTVEIIRLFGGIEGISFSDRNIHEVCIVLAWWTVRLGRGFDCFSAPLIVYALFYFFLFFMGKLQLMQVSNFILLAA